MRTTVFSSLVAVLLACTASAQTIRTANSSEVELVREQILKVVAATTNLSNGIWCYSGASDLANLVSASTAVNTSLNTGTALVQAISAQISFEQSLEYLLEPTVELNAISTTANNGIIARKNAFVPSCLGSTVLSQVTGLYNAAVQFRATIGSKFNAYDERIVELVSQEAIDALARGVAAYQDQNATCTPSTTTSATTTVLACSAGVYTGAATRATALPVLAIAGVAAFALL